MKTILGYFQYLLIVCATVVSFAACSSDDDDNGSNAAIDIISPADKQITCTGKDNGDVSISFTASNDWTAIPSHKWISLSKMTGSAGEHTIIVSVDDNDAYKSRIGTITIKDKVSGKSADITVTQGEKDGVLTFSTESQTGTSLVIDDENQTITAEVNVKSNYDYTITISPDWLSYENKGRQDDGSVKYVFHADTEKLYAAGGYDAQIATVSFAYQAETRAPATKEYAVKFEGITPKIESDLSPAILEDNGENYKAVIRITSNMLWTIGNKPSFADVEYTGGENKSKEYFETNTAIVITYNKEQQVEGEKENLTFLDAKGEALNYSIEVQYPGVGEDYVYLDNSAFDLGDDHMHTFDAHGEEIYPGYYDNLSLNFQVKAVNKENVTFYIVRQDHAGASVYSTYLDASYNEVSADMTGWNKWGDVDDPEEAEFKLSAVETITKSLVIKARGENEVGSSQDTDRYFAFFAVSSTAYPTFADMFDEEGGLKPELEGKYINCCQKAGVSIKDFICPELTGKTLEVAAAGETLEFQYTGLDLGAEKWAASWTHGDIKVVDGVLSNEPDWNGTGDMITYNFSDFTEGTGKISITVKPNTTKKARSENYAIFYGASSDGTYPVFTYFTIKQAAE